jgi:hypothetical protein
LLDALTALWERLRKDIEDLPHVTQSLTAATPRYNHGPERWSRAPDGTVIGLVVSGELLREGPDEVLRHLLHEAAHILAWQRNVNDTTMRGAYHNAVYLTTAEEVGLEWPEGAERSRSYGYNNPVVTDAARQKYADELATLADAIPSALPYLKPPTPTPSRPERMTLQCSCAEPRKLRMHKSIADRGPIICGVCGEEFKEPQ